MTHLWSVEPAYPAPRTRPSGSSIAAAPGQPAPPPMPNARSWPFALENNVNTGRQTIVSPRFIGPGLIKSVVFTRLIVPDPANDPRGFNLFYSNEDGGQTGSVVGGAVPAGIPLFDATVGFSVATLLTPQSDGLGFADAVNTIPGTPIRFDRVVPYNEFFLKASQRQVGVGTTQWFGVVHLFEACDPEFLLDLLG